MPQVENHINTTELSETEKRVRQTGPSILVIFGATGDLTKRKLFPAIYNLAKSNLLSREFAIVGVALEPMSTDAFRQLMGEHLDKFATGEVDPGLKDWMLKRLYYLSGDFKDPQVYAKLAQTLAEADKNHNTHGNYFFYLATSPLFFADIVERLGAAGLAAEKDGRWRRIVFEKPFGNDLESAKDLNQHLSKVLTENQIFRIDHYLGKETVQNILVFRFSNGIFEPIWNQNYVDHVQITVAETVGVENRASYFDKSGTLRDMVPNHLLQLLSLTAMEPPISFNSDAVHDEQSKVLHAIQPVTEEEVLHHAVRGQYDKGEVNNEAVPDYRSEDERLRHSNTETFVALKLAIDNWRWAGVPFYLRTGKRMKMRHTEVAIQFKRAPFVLFRNTPVNSLEANQLIVHIAPDERISMRFGAKVPGTQMEVRPAEMNYTFGSDPSTGYEILLYDGIIGDQTLFQRADMVEAGWSVITPILDLWKALPPRNFPNYRAGSWGPKEADDLINRDGRFWRKLPE